MLCEFVPASGSVIANATFVVPAAIGRTNLSLCSSVPCLRDDRADDRGRHDDQQQRRAVRRELLADREQPGMPEPAAAVLLRQVHARGSRGWRARPRARSAVRRPWPCRACSSGPKLEAMPRTASRSICSSWVGWRSSVTGAWTVAMVSLRRGHPILKSMAASSIQARNLQRQEHRPAVGRAYR